MSFPILPSFSCVLLGKEWREGGGVKIERVKVKEAVECNAIIISMVVTFEE